MLNEYKRLEQKQEEIKKTIEELPEGKLVLCSNGPNKTSWFCSNGKTKKYIKKKDIAFAQELAYKKFLTIQLEEIENEMRAINFYLRHHLKRSNDLTTQSEEFQKLLSVNFTPLNEELNTWMNMPYEKNKAYPEQLRHKTCTGEYVRSKTEAFIYTTLCKNRIPFRYECELRLGESVYYPDFTIRHPRTGELYYWEHLGLMDKPEYVHHVYKKLEDYNFHGIVQTINLITTYETLEHPMSLDQIEKIIEEYFQ